MPAETPVSESAAYGTVGVTLEARGLQPERPTASSWSRSTNTAKPVNEAWRARSRRHFTTAPGAVPQAATGAASAVGATAATISGTVNPDGQAATYSFELGVYDGAATQYGIVFSGPAGAGPTPVEETFGLTGLQPGTTYAFRIVLHSGYGDADGRSGAVHDRRTAGGPGRGNLAPATRRPKHRLPHRNRNTGEHAQGTDTNTAARARLEGMQ